MNKLGKKKSLVFSWEGPFLFLNYLDGNEFMEQDEGKIMWVVKSREEQLWDRPFEICNYIILHKLCEK